MRTPIRYVVSLEKIARRIPAFIDALSSLVLPSRFSHKINIDPIINPNHQLASMKLFVLFTISCVQAFSVLPESMVYRHRGRIFRLDGTPTPEEHLAELKGEMRDLQKQLDVVEATHDEEAEAILAEKFLEKAIEITETQEQIEEAHIEAAHKEYEKVLFEEDALKRVFDAAAHDAENADSILESLEKLEAAEDFEKRREIAVSKVAHNVENYVESRFRSAKEEELHAREEEEKAKKELDQLHMGEEGLKATLKAVKENRKRLSEDRA